MATLKTYHADVARNATSLTCLDGCPFAHLPIYEDRQQPQDAGYTAAAAGMCAEQTPAASVTQRGAADQHFLPTAIAADARARTPHASMGASASLPNSSGEPDRCRNEEGREDHGEDGGACSSPLPPTGSAPAAVSTCVRQEENMLSGVGVAASDPTEERDVANVKESEAKVPLELAAKQLVVRERGGAVGVAAEERVREMGVGNETDQELDWEAEFEREKARAEETKKELERERRRSKGLEAQMADAMRELAAERHNVATHQEKEGQHMQQIARQAEEARALSRELQEREHQLRWLRAYLSNLSQSQSQTDVSAQTEDSLLHSSEASSTPATPGATAPALHDAERREEEAVQSGDQVRLLHVQLAATRQILALQDRWMVAAGAVSAVDPQMSGGSSHWTGGGSEAAVDDSLTGSAGGEIEDASGLGVPPVEKEVVAEKLLQEWRQQVYMLLLREAALEAQHQADVAGLKRDVDQLETQVLGLRAELDMSRHAQVDLKAQASTRGSEVVPAK